MDEIVFINKKTKICELIKKVSDYYGGDDLEWLREYARDRISCYRVAPDALLECFLDLERQIDEQMNSVIII